jgi:hypothetical protein
LELLLLRLVLAGSDLGPVPGLERILVWAIGALAPAVLFWKRQADWGSLLFLRLPLRGRSQVQHQLSRDLQTLPVRLIAAAGVLPLLIVLWWIDASALLVADLTPFSTGSRLGSLLLATPLLAVLLWQWQQLVQALWLLLQPNSVASSIAEVESPHPGLQDSCLSLGLAVLQLQPLDWTTPPQSREKPDFKVANPSISSASVPEEPTKPVSDPTPEQASAAEIPASPTETAESEPDLSVTDSSGTADSPESHQAEKAVDADQAALSLSGTVEPEQRPEQHDGTNLNQEVAEDDGVSSTEAETHHEETEPPGSEQGEPDQPSETSPGGA